MTAHFADDPAQLPLDYLRGLACADPSVSVDEQYRSELRLQRRQRRGQGLRIKAAMPSFIRSPCFRVTDATPSPARRVARQEQGRADFGRRLGPRALARGHGRQQLADGCRRGQHLRVPECEPGAPRALARGEREGVSCACFLWKLTPSTLVIVKRYTGDVLHFGLAGESAGSDVSFVVVGDDVAVPRSQGELVGRRGLAGTCLVYKVAGHAAAQGRPLKEVTQLAQSVADSVVSIGASFAHCHVPGTQPSESLDSSEVEMGMGIHNEPGVQRRKRQTKADLVRDMVRLLTDNDDKERAFVHWERGDDAVVMLNNLGGLSELELVGLVPAVLSALDAAGIKPARLFVGTYMTSLDMPGFSITLLRLPRSGAERETILAGVDAPSSAPGWQKRATTPPPKPNLTPASKAGTQRRGAKRPAGPAFVPGIEAACRAVIRAEPEITRFDTVAGDGDCGLTLKAGAEGVLKAIQAGDVSADDAVGSVRAVAETVERDMGGTSGALYAIFFAALAKALEKGGDGPVSAQDWAQAAKSATDALLGYTKARPPSRTLVDPLVAFSDALGKGEDAKQAAAKAREAADNTKNLAATAGRAAYVDQEQLKKENVPDPGAYGLALIFEGLAGGGK